MRHTSISARRMLGCIAHSTARCAYRVLCCVALQVDRCALRELHVVVMLRVRPDLVRNLLHELIHDTRYVVCHAACRVTIICFALLLSFVCAITLYIILFMFI
jgi:hypothetical protein